jgi:predicted ATPase
LAAVIAGTLGIEQNDGQPVIDGVVDALHNKEMLLLIDNLEQEVEPAVEHINALLLKCPGVKLLVTSSEALQVSGAHTITVPPFAVPDPNEASFAEIRDAESVQLFVERAQAVREGFELTAENAQEVLQICHRLGGLPFSIELATSRMRSMNTTKLLRSLESIKVKDESGNTIYLVPR